MAAEHDRRDRRDEAWEPSATKSVDYNADLSRGPSDQDVDGSMADIAAYVVQRELAVGGTAARDDQMSSGPENEAAVVQAAARAGTSGGGETLPHGDVIQRSFGHHDVSGVVAHSGDEASRASKAMGAAAYATGNHVAFDGQPSLHLAAHEAAHVVQQRGGVQLKGGVGAAGDHYEQHADAVADLVVQGKSAESLLDAVAPSGHDGGAAGSAAADRGHPVQRLQLVGQPQGVLEGDPAILSNVNFGRQINQQRGVEGEEIFSLFDTSYSSANLKHPDEIIFIHGHGTPGFFANNTLPDDGSYLAAAQHVIKQLASRSTSQAETGSAGNAEQRSYEIRVTTCYSASKEAEKFDCPSLVDALARGMAQASMTGSVSGPTGEGFSHANVTYETLQRPLKSGATDGHDQVSFDHAIFGVRQNEHPSYKQAVEAQREAGEQFKTWLAAQESPPSYEERFAKLKDFLAKVEKATLMDLYFGSLSRSSGPGDVRFVTRVVLPASSVVSSSSESQNNK